jgi:hypothetical protein
VANTALLLMAQGILLAAAVYLNLPHPLVFPAQDLALALELWGLPAWLALTAFLALSATVLILRLKPNGWALAIAAQTCGLALGLYLYWRGQRVMDMVLLAVCLWLLISLHSTDFQRMFREKLPHA